jgi:hypothetical protein
MPGSNPSGQFYVYNKTRETFVATEATVADDYFRRLIGLFEKTKRWAKLGRGLWIIPSRGVHTIGMLFPIDVLFLNKNKRSHPHRRTYASIPNFEDIFEGHQCAGATGSRYLSLRNQGW